MQHTIQPKSRLIQGKKIRRKIGFAWNFFRLCIQELKAPVRVPLNNMIWAWRHGFLRESYVMNKLDRYNVNDNLSDFDRYVKGPRINQEFSSVLDNKILFERVLYKYLKYMSKIIAYKNQDKLFMLVGEQHRLVSIDVILDKISEIGCTVAKPVDGGGGENIFIIRSEGDSFLVNNFTMSSDKFESFITGLDGFIFSEYVQQHQYAVKIFPKTTNTIRILTMWDYEKLSPFIAIATHRFGSKSTIPVDNFTQGGLCSLVDLDTGVTGPGVSYPRESMLIWHDFHPDTGEKISGVEIPYWAHVKTKILEMAEEIPFVPYIGWDLVITNDGFKVIEGNNNSGIDILQVHKPLLTDQRVRNFYKAHQII